MDNHEDSSLNNIIIEGDNITIIKSLLKEVSSPWEIGQIIRDIEEDLRQCQSFKVNHCFREANGAADFMEKLSISCSRPTIWHNCFSALLGDSSQGSCRTGLLISFLSFLLVTKKNEESSSYIQ